MNPKQSLGKTSNPNGSMRFPDVALEEASGEFGRKHRISSLFLNLSKHTIRGLGYLTTTVVGASALVPAFLSFDVIFSNVPLYLKYIYAPTLSMGSIALGLTSYYIGSTTHNLVKAINEKIKLLKVMREIDPETLARLFTEKIEETK